MCEVDYNGRTSYASNYFYCRIQVQGLFYDAERDLWAIAKFFVSHCDGNITSNLALIDVHNAVSPWTSGTN